MILEILDKEDNDKPLRRRRSVYGRPNCSNSVGAVVLVDIKLVDPSSRIAHWLRRLYRVSHYSLVRLVERRNWFAIRSENAVGRQCIPVEIKLLGMP